MRGHSHSNARRLLVAAVLTGGFMVAEVLGGLLSGSLALIADAGHMLTDSISLGFAWVAVHLAGKPPDDARTYGYHRLQILVAFANGVALVCILAWIAIEAVGRLMAPVPVLGGMMLTVAVAGLAVNIAAFLALHGADSKNLNVRGAMLHVLGDLLGSIAAIVGGIVILSTGWTPIDPLLSLLVALILARSVWTLIGDAGHILLEGTPRGLDIGAITRDLVAAIAAVRHVHHVHVWSLSQERPMITLHARVVAGADERDVKAAIRARLADQFAIGRATIEVECEDTEAAR